MATGSRDPDLAPFVGRAHLGPSLLIAPAGAPPKLGYLTAMERDEAAGTNLERLSPEQLGVEELTRRLGSGAELWVEVIAAGLEHAGVAPGKVGLAGRFPAGTVHAACSRLAERGWAFEPAHELLLELRRTKTPNELAEIREVAAAAGEAMRAVAAALASSEPGGAGLELDGRPLTAGRLRRRIAAALAAHGMEQPDGNILAAGADAGVPHTQGGSDRVLRPGEALVVDLFPRGLLYADCTRTLCVGRPPAELARAHALVERALSEARGGAVAGRPACDLQRAACELFEEAGYPTPISHPGTTRGYVHGLGHGVGFELHEKPSFRVGSDPRGELAEGDVFTLEPGLYDPAAGWGVRLEDLCHLGAAGLEVLTPLPYDLDPEAWL